MNKNNDNKNHLEKPALLTELMILISRCESAFGQKRLLREIERYTGQRMEPMPVPTQADVATRRADLFKASVMKTLQEEDEQLGLYLQLVEEMAAESGCDMAEVAAASAYLAHEGKPLAVPLEPDAEQVPSPEEGMIRLFVGAGRQEGVRPADIVGASANEAGIPGKAIGAIDIYDHFTYVEVPTQYGEQVLQRMSDATIRARQANIRLATTDGGADVGATRRPRSKKAKRRKGKPQRQRKQ